MPQMSPIYWLILMMYFIFVMMIMTIYLFFLICLKTIFFIKKK